MTFATSSIWVLWTQNNGLFIVSNEIPRNTILVSARPPQNKYWTKVDPGARGCNSTERNSKSELDVHFLTIGGLTVEWPTWLSIGLQKSYSLCMQNHTKYRYDVCMFVIRWVTQIWYPLYWTVYIQPKVYGELGLRLKPISSSERSFISRPGKSIPRFLIILLSGFELGFCQWFPGPDWCRYVRWSRCSWLRCQKNSEP